MLFVDKIKELENKISPQFEKLFETTFLNQTHGGDLLLVAQNGLYNPEVYQWDNLSTQYSPYMIGPASIGHSEQTHYIFIQNYIDRSLCKYTLPEYLKKLKSETQSKTDEIVAFESSSIQLEMMVYLKIWEADAFLKKFHQVGLLLNQKSYDWHNPVPRVRRSQFINQSIKESFKSEFPILYDAFDKAYIGQIRNSIAHSNYSFMGRNIHPNNYDPNNQFSQLKNVSFDKWIDMIHYSLILYSEIMKFVYKINSTYQEIAKKQNNQIQVRITQQAPETAIIDYKFLKHSSTNTPNGRWSWS